VKTWILRTRTGYEFVVQSDERPEIDGARAVYVDGAEIPETEGERYARTVRENYANGTIRDIDPAPGGPTAPDSTEAYWTDRSIWGGQWSPDEWA
jgi:adenine-specific DNA methylase